MLAWRHLRRRLLWWLLWVLLLPVKAAGTPRLCSRRWSARNRLAPLLLLIVLLGRRRRRRERRRLWRRCRCRRRHLLARRQLRRVGESWHLCETDERWHSGGGSGGLRGGCDGGDGGVQLLRVLQHCPLLHLLLFDHSLHPFLLSLPLRLDLPRHLLLERITLTLKQVCEPPLVVVRAVAAAAARATEQWH